MMHIMRKGLYVLILAAFLITTRAYVSAQCEAEGNESEATGTAIGYLEVISDCVSSGNTEEPSEFEDPFDYYVMKIQAGDNVSGEGRFEAVYMLVLLYNSQFPR